MAAPAMTTNTEPQGVIYNDTDLLSMNKSQLQAQATALGLDFNDRNTKAELLDLIGELPEDEEASAPKVRNPRGTTAEKLTALVEEFGPELPCVIPLDIVKAMFCKSAWTYTMYWSKHNPGGRASRDVGLDCTLNTKDGEAAQLTVRSFEGEGEE